MGGLNEKIARANELQQLHAEAMGAGQLNVDGSEQSGIWARVTEVAVLASRVAAGH